MQAKKVHAVCIIVILMFFLVACGKSAEEKIYDHLEEAVQLEKDFEKQQSGIIDLENKEREYFDQITELGMDEFEKIKELSKQAIDSIDERGDMIKLEKASIDASREEIKKAKEIIDNLKEETVKNKAKKMYEMMMKRYQAYDELNKAYARTLKLEKDLYVLLQDEDAEQKALTEHIENLNSSYDKVIDANGTFNDYTEQYNQLKQEFYNATDMEIAFNKEQTE